jgi:apolipoprotein N-acyltransferase
MNKNRSAESGFSKARCLAFVSPSRDFRIAAVSGILLWCAFPPLGWWPLAWIAPAGWVYLARHAQQPGGRLFLRAYIAGFIHWMLLIHWIRLPHWSAYFGWIALSGYLAVYPPVFISTTRVCVRCWKLPSVLAAPIVWAGLELARGYLLTGFSMSLLGHSQVTNTSLLQIADLFGAYGISFVVMTVAAAIERTVGGWGCERFTLFPVSFATILLSATIGYGWWSQQELLRTPERRPKSSNRQIALVQAVYDTQFDGDESGPLRAFEDYLRLSRSAVKQNAQVDLVVWPESMFSANAPVVSFEEPILDRPDIKVSAERIRSWLQEMYRFNNEKTKFVAAQLQTRLLVGTERIHVQGQNEDRYNSAVFISADGDIESIYDKMHPVMFGEYVPFGDLFPWLYRLTPMVEGLTAGKKPVCIDLDGVCLLPCICFENAVPHLLRGNVARSRRQGKNPDALVTITNDGWFWGSSLLDAHLACGIFRAVELRRPMLIAANTGISAWISPEGRLLASAKRRTEDVLIAEIGPAARSPTIYERIGDLPALLCLLVAIVAMIDGLRRARLPVV